MSLKRELYLINNGTTCNDIHQEIIEYYRLKKKEGHTFDNEYINILKKIKQYKGNKLSMNGIIESRELKKDDAMNSLKNSNNNFYCLCDRVSIETALIYLHKESNFVNLIVLPYIKSEKEIRKPIDLTNFKKSFGKNNYNNMKNYWSIKENIINSKKSVKIDWSLLDSMSFSDIKHFSLVNLKNYVLNNIKSSTIVSKKFILICNQVIIKDFLKDVKNEKYKLNSKMKIYNTHCLKLNYIHNISKSNIELENYDTFYPIKLGNNLIKYEYEGKKYKIMFKQIVGKKNPSTLNIIPESRCIDNNLLHKIITKLNSRKKNNNNMNNVSQKNNNITNFESVFSKFNKN